MESESSFWAIELTKGNPECMWPAETPDDEAEEAAEHVLEVERACLGVSAKANDLNVVSVATFVNDGESTAITPIARLKVNGKEQCRIGLQFNSQVVFKLTSGNGPVHLMGLKETAYEDEGDLEAMEGDDSEDDEDDSEEESEEEAVPALNVASRKRPAISAMPPAKKQQRGMPMPGDDDSEDDDEDDSDDEMNLMAGLLRGKAAGAADDDSEEDDDDDEDMDDDDDEDDDDDDEDSDEEPPKLVQAKMQKQQKDKAAQQQQKQQQKQPQKQQQQKGAKPQAAGKPGQQSKPQTPQKGKADAAAAGPPSFDAILKKLTSSPNLPKKQDKFVNLLKNNYLVKDQKMINELWTRVQKGRN